MELTKKNLLVQNFDKPFFFQTFASRYLNKSSMKRRKHNLIQFILLLLITQNVATVQAQIRVGGSVAPTSGAILDLNADDTVNGSMGLLLPRVALVSTAHTNPLMAHVTGMFVYNTATANDVLPGVYHNDGTQWVRYGEPPKTEPINVRRLEIAIDETICTYSVMYYGKTTAAQSSEVRALGIEPVFSDEIMSQMLFTVSSFAKPDEMGTMIEWSVKVSNANINPDKSCRLKKIVIIYVCDHELSVDDFTKSCIFVGQ